MVLFLVPLMSQARLAGSLKFKPPASVASAAKRGLSLRAEHGRGGTSVGLGRGKQLASGEAIGIDTLKKMHSYLARHEVDKQGEGWGEGSNGQIAWDLWGGDSAKSWVSGLRDRLIKSGDW